MFAPRLTTRGRRCTVGRFEDGTLLESWKVSRSSCRPLRSATQPGKLKEDTQRVATLGTLSMRAAPAPEELGGRSLYSNYLVGGSTVPSPLFCRDSPPC